MFVICLYLATKHEEHKINNGAKIAAVRRVANGKFSFPESGLRVQDCEWFRANNTGFALRVVHNGFGKTIFQQITYFVYVMY